MKKIFALVLTNIILGLSVAQATSLHPCTPVIEAKPARLSCSQNDLVYAIRIDTVMSDVRRCPVKDLIEVNTAQVTVISRTGTVLQKVTIPHDEFTYTLGALGDATFQSDSHSLDLRNCSAPMHGGFSVGN